MGIRCYVFLSNLAYADMVFLLHLYHDAINLINEYYDKLELKVYACCLVPFS